MSTTYRAYWPCIFLLILIAFSSCRVQNGKSLSYDPSGSTNTRSKPISFQEKKRFAFPEQGIYFDNQFPGARLNEVVFEDSLFKITITPENAPINMSPWYAFKLWSTSSQQIKVKLTYEDGKHRYHPKVSRNEAIWAPLAEDLYLPDTTKGTATLLLNASTDTLWVAAQELNPPSEVYKWVNTLGKKPWVTVGEIGESTEKRPLKWISIGKQESKHIFAVISGQHPPEITGYKAMQSFVEAIAGETELAKRFRATFETVVVPHMNPDGIFHGHWRHNVGGVDLNRDWDKFRQPETKAFSSFFKKKVKKQRATMHYAVDFHSTWHDVFYTLDEENFLEEGSITRSWINGIIQAFPDYALREEPFAAGSPVSKNWFYHTFGSEAVTYEVGDNTPRPELKELATQAAEIMMEVLLKEVSEQP